MSFVDDLIDKCNDLNRRLSFIERLDVNPPVTSVPKYSGTPVAGRYAYWTGPGTVADSGFGTADLPRYSGTPSAGAAAYWTGAGTIAMAGYVTMTGASTTTGTALAVVRNLTSASTNSPVVSIEQSHSGDDQVALKVKQFANAGATQVISEGSNNLLAYWDAYSNTATRRPVILFRRARGTEASPTIVSAGDQLSSFEFWGYDGSNFQQGGAIQVSVDGTPGTASMPGLMLFATTPSGAAAGLTALAINSSQQTMVGGITSAGATWLGIKAGTSSNDAAVGGVLYSDSSDVGNVGTGEDDLTSYTVPANTLSANNMSLRVTAWGSLSTANSKTIKFYFGSDSINFMTGNTSTGDWQLTVIIIRTGAATQKYMAHGSYSSGGNQLAFAQAFTMTRTLSSSNVVKFTGTATSNNDIVQEGMIVEFLDANT